MFQLKVVKYDNVHIRHNNHRDEVTMFQIEMMKHDDI